jgi:hypothetical protein
MSEWTIRINPQISDACVRIKSTPISVQWKMDDVKTRNIFSFYFRLIINHNGELFTITIHMHYYLVITMCLAYVPFYIVTILNLINGFFLFPSRFFNNRFLK